MNRFILLLILLLFFAFNGTVAFSEDSSASNVSQSYTLDSVGESFKTGSTDGPHFSSRYLDKKRGNNQATEANERKTASPANELKLFKYSPYNIFTLYPDESGPTRLLNDDPKPVGGQTDPNSWFNSGNSKTKFFVGTIPFVSVPVSNNHGEEQDVSFISKDSIFVFWYFKRSF